MDCSSSANLEELGPDQLRELITDQQAQLCNLDEIKRTNETLRAQLAEEEKKQSFDFAMELTNKCNGSMTSSELVKKEGAKLNQYQKLQLLVYSINVKQHKNIQYCQYLLKVMEGLRPRLWKLLQTKRVKPIPLLRREVSNSLYMQYCMDETQLLKEVEQLIARIAAM